ncbi:hypothetical protein AYL99_05174 [Fonsecaea erecta]|uniref:Helicase C-terminal domain-containing protein n=1 Tax=Fonsecaea erecta TaxID=1367422 RepID=A0A178ZKI0_9EURO|nr:hypothetical protein AYL99_05174 [Fonsecaea erecta]OAP60172.1 hypothetical protein AYL99_05174 [Fonsecaea erecta]
MGNALSGISPTTAAEGSRVSAATLLSRMQRERHTLTDMEVDIIAAHLDAGEPETLQDDSTAGEYVSAEFAFGEERSMAPVTGVGEHAALEQFDPTLQEQAFRFVKSDHRIERRLRRSRAWVSVAGVALRFFPHQLYAAFWLLVYERGPRRGAILADSMGLGKTTTAYLYIILNYLLAHNLDHIRQHPRMHCQPSAPGRPQAVDARCPVSHFFGVECACQEYSVASRLGLSARNGASLILLPAGLIGVWVSEFVKLGLSPRVNLRLYVQHRSFASSGIPTSQTHLLHRDPGSTQDVRANHFVVLTSVESYHDWVQEYCRRGRPSGLDQDAGGTSVAVRSRGLRWARVLRDEAHLTPNLNTRLYSILEVLARDADIPPNFVALTGTPMLRGGVRDMLALVHVINQVSPELKNSTEHAGFVQLSQLSRIADDFLNAQVRVDSGSEAVVGTVRRLLVAYCIRRHAHSLQNGKTIARIPPLICYDVSCPSDEHADAHYLCRAESMLRKHLSRALETQRDRWLAEGGSPSQFRVDVDLLLENVRMARILATMPALAHYGPRGELTWNAVKRNGWHVRCQSSKFYHVLPELEATSGKLQALRRFVALWEPTRSSDGHPESLVVISEFAFVCHVIECFLTKMGISCVWLHADVNSKTRQELVDAFQDPQANPRIPPFRVMIGTSQVLGQGLTLTRAHRGILVEPSHHAAVEAQNADRTHRLGSRTDKCRFYRLVNPASRIERFLIESQVLQRDLQNSVEWMEALSASPLEPDDQGSGTVTRSALEFSGHGRCFIVLRGNMLVYIAAMLDAGTLNACWGIGVVLWLKEFLCTISRSNQDHSALCVCMTLFREVKEDV